MILWKKIYKGRQNELIKIRKLIGKNINIGKWFHHQKEKINSSDDNIYIELSLNKYVKKSLDDYLNKKKE